MNTSTIRPLVKERLSAINGLRGIAILMVICHHTLSYTVSKSLHIFRMVHNGWTGVNLFFILSGFVLYRPYFLGERHFNTWQDVKWFYKHRFYRLYPLFALNVLISVSMNSPISWTFLKSGLLSLTTLTQFTTDNFFPIINPVLWSLMLEIWFSVFFPLLILLINRFGFSSVLVSSLIIALVFRLVGYRFEFSSSIYVTPFKDNFFARLDDFVAGMLVVRLYYQHTQIKAWPLTIVSLLALLASFHLWDMRALNQLPDYIMPFLNILIIVGFCGLTLSALQTKSFLWYIFSFKPLQLTGMMCYSIYLWHFLIHVKIEGLPGSVNYLIYAVIVFCISALTYRYIEFGSTKDYRKLFLLDDTK
ncbi:acyltransferase [Cytophagaceae bacterium YF14B1]|uniref:Acyltransferase n=1 Tax=Xanthocytophaga flava TaxID=3048013 RepID=A0AAE3QPL2_9BACT|nr:acyltransferase [Xanthocytophaga flavus]MDJ1480383.1 acyltransferase [Xanthocytophaga flavus]